MAKIAPEHRGRPPQEFVLASDDGWSVSDVLCTSGPEDRPFEERHQNFSIAMVLAGNFQYRSETGRELMSSGSLLLGNAGQGFECGHEHGVGDRCLSFKYHPEYFARIAADAGLSSSNRTFKAPRIPPLPELSQLLAAGCAVLAGQRVAVEELNLQLAVAALQLSSGVPAYGAALPPGAESRVAKVLRQAENETGAPITLEQMARVAGLSPFHFLRTFERVAGVTPHQYLLRKRLRDAAIGLTSTDDKIVDVAFDCGFGDLSNFNRAFRREFGVSPKEFRGGRFRFPRN